MNRRKPHPRSRKAGVRAAVVLLTMVTLLIIFTLTGVLPPL